ncbi:unnamed protein product [Psylliodes chrysocephalus]|uniref:Tetraspanin n=1 Tax=Psylliodes chrysocephalus TaxID=3402493 RepID=A0A9P0G6I4_9CUCU|nr:unnamed protein product [Psylliodes chrysocephala]
MKSHKMGCDEDLVKCAVFWTNFILALVGISLISLGIIYKVNYEEIIDAIPDEFDDLTIIPVLIIPVGTSLIVLAVFGCYGCLTEKIKYVIVYIIILLLQFVIQLGIGINAIYKLGNEQIFKHHLDVTMEDVFRRSSGKQLVDLIQHRLRCCGFNGPDFWDHLIPRSCLKTDSTDIFRSSCSIEMFEYVKYCQHVLGTVIIVLSLAEIIASIVSLFFVHYLKNNLSRDFIFIKEYTFEEGEI